MPNRVALFVKPLIDRLRRAATRLHNPRVQILAALSVGLLAGIMAMVVSCAGGRENVSVIDHTGRLLSPPLMRVLVNSGSTPMTLSCEGRCLLVSEGLPSGSTIFKSLSPAHVRLADGTLTIGDLRVGSREAMLMALDEQPLALNDTQYLGSLRVVAQPNNTAVAINLIDLESYLLSVLPSEMPSRWHVEALKAQAVAARTYALSRRKKRADEPWHVVATTADQVYKGWQRPVGNVEQALRETRGVVMTHQGTIFTAYYSSTCGGHTGPPARILTAQDAAFIEGRDCPFCVDSKYHRWEARIPREELAGAVSVSPPLKIDVHTAGPEKTATEVTIKGRGGALDMSPDRFMTLCGRHRFRSKRFQVHKDGGDFVIRGRGFGHGCGMCQYGARGAAEQGWTYDEIVHYYYGDIDLVRIY